MYRRVKTITGYAAHYRFLNELDGGAEADPIGHIPNPRDIPSPYSYSPSRGVYLWNGRRVFVMETAHRRYEVYEVPPTERLYNDDAAASIYIANTHRQAAP